MRNSTSFTGKPRLFSRFSKKVRGIIYMIIAALTAAIMHSQVRGLSQHIHPFEIAFFRNIIAFLTLVPFLLNQGRSAWICKRPFLMFIRSLAGVGALLTYFFGLSLIPVGDATALSFSVIIFATIGAMIFLGEKVGVRRWMAIIIGLLGTLIILRPGLQSIGPGVIAVFISTLLWASAWLMVKVLSQSDTSITIVFYSSFYFCIFSIPFAIWYWVWPSWIELGNLVIIGVLAALGMLCTTESLKMADASVVMPFDFTRLIWAAAIGYWFFNEFPDMWVWLGAGVVFLSTLYITYRETITRDANKGK